MITPLSFIRAKFRSQYVPCIGVNSVQGACHKLAILGLVLSVITAGCSPRYHDMPEYWPIPTREYDNYGPGRFKTALLAQQIDRYYRSSHPGPIGVTTFVNIDDLYASSTFGRMVGEQLMSELAMKGFDVVELRHADALQFLDTSGEFALSRDARAVRGHRNLSAVVVGTYVVSPERVYVNARLIEPSTSLILSAGSVEMSKTRELAKLLRGGSMPGSLERIPVKHLGYAERDSAEAMRRSWILEEEGGGAAAAGRFGTNQQRSLTPGAELPQFLEPLKSGSGDGFFTPNTASEGGIVEPPAPQVSAEEKPKLSIGLGR
jgi:TolB-like protein